ncbi:MAG TPA: J domain-containing protein [Candidatus Saccharimonadia bacterium]|nr:J domain-containing protein [Candidatus Saccharimonadia bacterium]
MSGEGRTHYQVLGLAHAASPAEIKVAYRVQAKAAHPDAGGSAETMAQVNEAYQVLSDPVRRRAYDESLIRPQTGEPAPHHAGGHAHHAGTPSDSHAQEQRINRERAQWARNSAWELLRIAGPAAVILIPVTRYISIQSTGGARIIAGLIAFIPTYATILSIMFLLNPPLRLVFADLVRRFHTTREERISGLGLILAAIPLAAIWIWLFY